MKAYIILALIFASMISMTHQQSKATNAIDCLKTEAFTHMTGLVLDLYYGKLTFGNFIEKYLAWSMRTTASQISSCVTQEVAKILSDTAVSKVGYTLLYASNCEKDLGPAFIVFDIVLQNLQNIKAEWKTAIMNSFTLAIIGYQSYNDCQASFQAIKDLWTASK
jgi:hypothetical protein